MNNLDILNGKQERNTIVDNKHNVLRFKEDIARLVEKQKSNRAMTRKPHDSDTWRYQNEENKLKYELFTRYTAYYIVKHYLWLDENKEKCEEYMTRLIEHDAKHATHKILETSEISPYVISFRTSEYAVEHFRDKVKHYVREYTTK